MSSFSRDHRFLGGNILSAVFMTFYTKNELQVQFCSCLFYELDNLIELYHVIDESSKQVTPIKSESMVTEF